MRKKVDDTENENEDLVDEDDVEIAKNMIKKMTTFVVEYDTSEQDTSEQPYVMELRLCNRLSMLDRHLVARSLVISKRYHS